MKQNLHKYIPIVAGAVTLIAYLPTLAPSVQEIDSGELAAVQWTLGVAHPTGYPLFAILGFIWSHLFPFGSVIFRLNLLSAIYVAAGNYFFVRTISEILHNWQKPSRPAPAKSAKKETAAPVVKQHPSDPLLNLIAALGGLGFAAFSHTYWKQSTGVEVYSLHILLLNAILFLSFRAFLDKDNATKNWKWLAVALGLSFANHMTTILVLPGIAVLYVAKNGVNARSIRQIGIMLGIFAAVLIPLYAYLPIRASANPLINWGNTRVGEYFWRHVTGKQYQVWMFSSKKVADLNLSNFFKSLPQEMTVLGLVFMVCGLLYAFIKNKTIALVLALNAIITVGYSINYAIPDLQPYFLLAYISIGILATLTIRLIFEYVELFRQKPAVGLITLGLPVFMYAQQYAGADESKNNLYSNYSQDALNSVEENAIIISRRWAIFVSPAYYFQHVEKQRQDVLIVDKELLKRTWYYLQLARWSPGIMGELQNEVAAFNEAVLPFEREQRYDGNKIQAAYEGFITAIIEKNYRSRPVYFSNELVDGEIMKRKDIMLPKGSILMPDAYFYRVIPASDTTTYYPVKHYPVVNFEFPEKDNENSKQVKEVMLSVMSARVGYEMQFGHREEAQKIWQVIREIRPDVQAPPGLF